MRTCFASVALLGASCGSDEVVGSPFAVEVVSFLPGPGAGFGQDELPDVVLGPPSPAGSPQAASLGVLSLGLGGSIVVRLGRAATDGPGPDLVVFENPFLIAGGPRVFGESGEVAVSDDGEQFEVFACDPEAEPPAGCAGWGVVTGSGDDFSEDAPVDPRRVGGDAFDLAAVGLDEATFIRITDRGATSAAPSAGFDLDAVAAAAGDGA